MAICSYDFHQGFSKLEQLKGILRCQFKADSEVVFGWKFTINLEVDPTPQSKVYLLRYLYTTFNFCWSFFLQKRRKLEVLQAGGRKFGDQLRASLLLWVLFNLACRVLWKLRWDSAEVFFFKYIFISLQ